MHNAQLEEAVHQKSVTKSMALVREATKSPRVTLKMLDRATSQMGKAVYRISITQTFAPQFSVVVLTSNCEDAFHQH